MYEYVNVVQDSFHVIELINNYINSDFDPKDKIIYFRFGIILYRIKTEFLMKTRILYKLLNINMIQNQSMNIIYI